MRLNSTIVFAVVSSVAGYAAPPTEVVAQDRPARVEIGSRRELFVDAYLIDRLGGKAERRLEHPQPREIALTHDAPWEGAGSGYHSVFRDGRLYRMYYRGSPLEIVNGKLRSETDRSFLCYAESDDGIRWRKPELGLHEFQGSKANNIVMVPRQFGDLKADPGHVAVFKDENPDAPAEARYKAIIRSGGKRGLYVFQSADGFRWKPMSDAPVITAGAFDSQNLAFWDPTRRVYRAYWRYFTEGVVNDQVWKPAGHRAIRTAVSSDMLNWTEQADLTYVDSPSEQLYTNQVKPYHRAPHILLGLPVRYVDRGWSDSMRALPEREHRETRSKANPRYGTAVTEALLMASRDGVRFERWNEAFLRPGIEREGTWQYGQNYIAWHLVETKSDLPEVPDELSLYAAESYWTGGSSVLRRYTLRLDGFVAVHAPMSGGTLLTKPLTFSGGKLSLNMATSAAGTIRVELQTADGEPIAGHALADSSEIFGDSIDRMVTWKNGGDVSKLAGKPVRLLVELRDADLYSFQFE
jgi:hypothetical protein